MKTKKTKSFKTSLLGVAFTTLIASQSTLAATETESNQSVAEKPRSFKEKVMLNYWGNFAGPALDSFTSESTTNIDNFDGAANLYNSIQAGYKFNSAQALYVNPRFSTRFTTDANGNGFGATEWHNPRFGFKDSKMYVSKSGDTSLYGNIHVELPLGDGSNTSLAAAPGFSNFLTVNFQGSRWSYGQWSTFRLYFYGRKPDADQKTVQIEFYPEMDYKISNSVNFRFLARFEYGAKGQDSFSLRENIDQVLFVLQPGITWDIANNLNINPYIQLQPKKGFSFESSAIGMEISGTVF